MFEDPDVLADRLTTGAPSCVGPDGRPWILPDLDPDEVWTDRLAALERVKAAAEAEQIMVMSAMLGWAQDWVDQEDARIAAESGSATERLRRGYGSVSAHEVAADHLAPALRMSPTTAAIKLDRAARITSRLPGSLAAMRRGDLDLARLLAIDDATRDLGDAAARAVEKRILDKAPDQTAAELRAALRKAVVTIDPAAAERRRKAAMKDRKVARYAGPDGRSVLAATLSAIDSGEIYDLVDEVARRTKTSDDARTMDQRRADAFVHLLLGRDPHLGPEDPPAPAPDTPPPGPEDGPPDPADHDTRAPDNPAQSGQNPPGGDDAADPDDAAESHDAVGQPGQPSERDRDDPGMPEPPDLDDRFPPLPDRISELAALAISAMASRRPPRLPWVAINTVTGPDGALVMVGELQDDGPITVESAIDLLLVGAARPRERESTRDPTPAEAANHDPAQWLARDIRARDGTCRFPGCRRAAHRVDLDHNVPFPRGCTVRTNLAGLCRRHHRTKTAGVWRVDQSPDGDGTLTWTSNLTGQRYTTTPRGTTGDWTGAKMIRSVRLAA